MAATDANKGCAIRALLPQASGGLGAGALFVTSSEEKIYFFVGSRLLSVLAPVTIDCHDYTFLKEMEKMDDVCQKGTVPRVEGKE